jgi:lambda repressor-like predicted transcriptional regulator
MKKKTSVFQVNKICSILFALLMAVTVQAFAESAKNKSAPIDIAADLIGVDVDMLWKAVKNGQTLAEVATANGVAPQTLIDALLAEKQAGIDAKVASGKMTAEEAAEWLAKAEIGVAKYVNDPIEFDRDGKDRKDGKGQYDFPPVILELLGIEKAALWEAVKNGQTLAEIATANGVDPQTLINALLAEKQAGIDAKVASGKITAEEAAEWLAKAEIGVVKYVNEPIEFDKDGKDRKDGKGKYNLPSISLADIATANGMAPQVIIDALLAYVQADINAGVASGKITAEEATGWLAKAEIRVAEYVYKPIELNKDGKDRKDAKGKYDFPPVILELLGIEKAALWKAVKSGQTIADIAIANGVEPQTIGDALLAEVQADINAAVASGKITAEEAAEWLAKAEIKVDKFVYEPIFRSYPKDKDSKDKARNDKPSADKKRNDRYSADKKQNDKPSADKKRNDRYSADKKQNDRPSTDKASGK